MSPACPRRGRLACRPGPGVPPAAAADALPDRVADTGRPSSTSRRGWAAPGKDPVVLPTAEAHQVVHRFNDGEWADRSEAISVVTPFRSL